MQRTAARIEPWKAIVAAGAVLLGAGATFGLWQAGQATLDDVAQARAAVTAEVELVRKSQEALEIRTTKTETDLTWIKSTLYEIAKRTGALSVPPPPP